MRAARSACRGVGFCMAFSVRQRSAPKPLVPEITQEELKQLPTETLLFDTRPEKSFAEGTIPGAVSFPVDSSLEEAHENPGRSFAGPTVRAFL